MGHKGKAHGQAGTRCDTYVFKALITVVLLSSLWPPNQEDPEDVKRGFGSDCPFAIDDFLRKRNELLLPAFRNVQPMPGAVRLIQHLSKHNIPICVRKKTTYKEGCYWQSSA